MATVSVPLSPMSAEFFTTVQPPELLVELNTGAGTGANASPVTSLAFDQTTLEAAYWTLTLFNYGSGNVSVLIDWFATPTSGNAVWGAQWQSQTPGDAQSVLTDALAAAATTTTATSGTASGPVRTTVTVSSLDSFAAGDIITLKVYRDAANGSDTLAADAKVRAVTLQYSDT